MKTQVVLVGIRRGLTSEPVDAVYAHEVPILKLIRGTGNITVYEENCTRFALKPKNIKPRDELLRLKKKYRGFVEDGQNPVDVTFPDGSRDLELFYEDPESFNASTEQEGGGMITDDVEETPEIEDEEEPEAEADEIDLELPATAPTAIDLNDRQAVLAKLEELGVPFAKTLPTKHLATLLTNSLEPGATD